MLVSGSCNGEIKLWDLSTLTSKLSVDDAHAGFVTGLTYRGDIFLSCGQDKAIKCWGTDGERSSYSSKMACTGIDMTWADEGLFAVSGTEGLELWDVNRSQPISQYAVDIDSLLKVKFNPSETMLCGTTGNDRSVILYDARSNSAAHRIVLTMKSNDLAWNPREPMNFTLANEDSNLYTFDMRNMSEARKIHRDHLNAVTSISYNPNGREFASGSFDRTVRIFDVRDSRSREVYHTRRMQWIYAVEFTADGKFILSGSDDTNLRLWKSKAHVPLKTLLPREQEAMNHREKLKRAYNNLPEIKRILRHRHLPRLIYKQKKKREEMQSSEFRKEQNRKAHSRAEDIVEVPARKKVVQQEFD
jgi:WD repeat and SOF domain-containing protein 1